MKQKNYINEGFAIWLEGNKFQSDVHINQWLLPINKSFIDFGIRIYEVQEVNKIGLFIPYQVDETEIEDLCDKMYDEKVARGVFNALCTITQSSTSGIMEIEYNNRKENIIKLALLKIEIKKIDLGTIVFFDLSPIKKKITKDEIYIRFRLPHKSLSELFLIKKPSIKLFFESPVIKYQYNYTLKLNEVRSLPWEVRNISNLTNQDIKKVIITASIDDKYDINNSRCYKVRQLESELFHPYVPDEFECSNVTSYSWRSELRKYYNFNFEINTEIISKIGLLKYAIIVVILSAIGSALWTGVTELFEVIISMLG